MADETTPAPEKATSKPSASKAPAPAPVEERLYHETELTGGSFVAVGGGMYRKLN